MRLLLISRSAVSDQVNDCESLGGGIEVVHRPGSGSRGGRDSSSGRWHGIKDTTRLRVSKGLIRLSQIHADVIRVRF